MEQLNRNLYYITDLLLFVKYQYSLWFSVSLNNANSKIVVKEEVQKSISDIIV
jgi:hypothetical protein